jgi:Cu(I)/Ag(I) efflux system membrane protein CusA/SilA
MIDKIIEFSIRNRWLVLALAAALALGGFFALRDTPVDAIPDLSENQVIVFTEWPGHSPREIEDQVTYPLTLNLQGMSGVRVIRSASDFNFSMISVILEDSVDSHAARSQVAERLTHAATQLPSGVTPNLAPDAAATGQIFWYTVEGSNYDLGRLRAIQDWYVRPQLSSIPGVAEVASVGGYATEYQIDVDPIRLQGQGVALRDLVDAVARSNGAVGGQAWIQPNSEYLVRSVGWLGGGSSNEKTSNSKSVGVIRDLQQVLIPTSKGGHISLLDVATIHVGPQPRRGVLEKDGNEVTGGVVLMRQGENPLEVTARIKEKIREIQSGLPSGVRIASFYDRTPLIEGAVNTVTRTLIEAIITATICVLLILLHFRTSFIIAITLPLAVLTSFGIMWIMRRLGAADIQTNIMSLAGIAISIGVLVDSSIVMAENAMHSLKKQFGEQRVQGNVCETVLASCKTVGRPIFFSVVIMLLSFLPVFALGGMEGKMFRPLAFTKSFALLAVAILAVTLVPALCTIFIRGRLRNEQDSWLLRSVVEVYRPVLNYFLDHPAGLVWIMGVTLVIGLAPLGVRWIFLGCLLAALVGCAWMTRHWATRLTAIVTLVIIARIADANMHPLQHEFITPLNERMVMDMPLSWPRASVLQSADDLKARDMIFCRFPEVDMVVGKAGRADTPTDPAPMDMIETMVNFRPTELWPKRKLHQKDAELQAASVLEAIKRAELITFPEDRESRTKEISSDVVQASLFRFDALMREYCYQHNQEFQRELAPQLVRFAVEQLIDAGNARGAFTRPLTDGDVTLLCSPIPQDIAKNLALGPSIEDVTLLIQQTAEKLNRLQLMKPGVDLLADQSSLFDRAAKSVSSFLSSHPANGYSRIQERVTDWYISEWRRHVSQVNSELPDRAAATFTRVVLDELLHRIKLTDPQLAEAWNERERIARGETTGAHHHHANSSFSQSTSGRRNEMDMPSLQLEPIPALDKLLNDESQRFARGLLLWRISWSDLTSFGGELDRVMQMPGWTNVWTMPIQNRVDMLATGVNTPVGIRVLGRDLNEVVQASEDIAAVVKDIPGAANVIAEPVRGKGYLEVHPDRAKAARLGVSVGDVNDLIEVALGGKVVTTTIEGRERYPVRVRYPSVWRESDDMIGGLLVPVLGQKSKSEIREQGFRSSLRSSAFSADKSSSIEPQRTQRSAEKSRDLELRAQDIERADSVPLSTVAEIRTLEGPAKIKSENGLLRNYVNLTVRGRDEADWVAEAKRVVAERVHLPPGVVLEWTGQFEHEVHMRKTLAIIFPIVAVLIFLILWWTYHDLADAGLMMLAVPGALAGGVIAQWLFDYKFSVTVWVGYIACFGMATATGIIMLVYLREAVAKAGGLGRMTLAQLRQAVMDGAVHRLRPKLLTEGTCILGLAPLLWATGPGAEVIRPMVIPVLGGILIADEVIDLFLPVLFFRLRRRRWERLQQLSVTT